MGQSEFNTKPRKILIHHPRTFSALESLTDADRQTYNFIEVPDINSLYAEYDSFIQAINAANVETVNLADLLATEEFDEADLKNPNLMFTRDSSITLPWDPQSFIPTRMALPSRKHETVLTTHALSNLGLSPIVSFEEDEYIEGGDVLPIWYDNLRSLIIGFGTRTTQSAALKLAQRLIPSHIDQILCLRHDPQVLHLDTGFTVLPNRVVLAAKGMFNQGFIIDKSMRIIEVDPIAFAESEGFTIIRTTKQKAIYHESCNMLPLGNNQYIAFSLEQDLKDQIERTAKISIHEINGKELAKTSGGVHCLTRPIY